MSLLAGASALTADIIGGGGLASIANALFPNEVKIRFEVENQFTNQFDVNEVNLDATFTRSVSTTISVSEHPSEDEQTFVQNVYLNPKVIGLTCILSNVLRIGDVKSLSAATQFASALLIPEVAQVTNVALNEEDNISIRLDLLRFAQENGIVVQVLGLPDQEFFTFILESIADNETVETGDKARAVDITLRQVFIVGVEEFEEEGGIFSTVTEELTGAIDAVPAALLALVT